MTDKKLVRVRRRLTLLFALLVLAAGLLSQLFMVQSVYLTELERVTAIRLNFLLNTAIKELGFNGNASDPYLNEAELSSLFLYMQQAEPSLSELVLLDFESKAQETVLDLPQQTIKLELLNGSYLQARFKIEKNFEIKQSFSFDSIITIVLIIGISGMVLWFLPSRMRRQRSRNILLAIFLSQLAFAAVVLVRMDKDISLVQSHNKELITKQISHSLEKLLVYGIQPSEWHEMDKALSLDLVEPLKSMHLHVLDSNKNVLFSTQAGFGESSNGLIDHENMVLEPLRVNNSIVAYLAANLQDEESFDYKIGLILGQLSLMLVSILIAIELYLALFRRLIEKYRLARLANLRKSAPKVRKFLLMRGLIFSFFVINFISFGISWSFIEPSLAIVSVYLLGVAFGGIVMRRLTVLLNSQRAMEWTLLAAFFGTLVFLIDQESMPLLILSRLIAGLAHGGLLGLNAVEEAGNTSSQRFKRLWRNQINAGFTSGLVVGLCLGVLAYSRFSPDLIFKVSACAMGLVYVLSVIFKPLAGTHIHLIALSEHVFSIRTKKGAAPAVFLLVGLMLPLQLASAGSFYFIFPVFMTSRGLDFAWIARVLSMYALIVMAGPIIRQRMQGYKQERIFLMAAYLLCGISLIAMIFSPDHLMIALAVLCVGVSELLGDGLSIKALFAYPKQPLGKHGQAIPVFQLVERLNACLVPLIAASLLLFLDIAASIAVIAIIALLGAVCLAWFLEGKGR